MRWTLASLLLVACANSPQREEAAPPLIVPPLDADAGAAATPRAEPRHEVQSPLAIPARDLALIAGYKLVVGRGYELAVNFAGKAATYIVRNVRRRISLKYLC